MAQRRPSTPSCESPHPPTSRPTQMSCRPPLRVNCRSLPASESAPGRRAICACRGGKRQLPMRVADRRRRGAAAAQPTVLSRSRLGTVTGRAARHGPGVAIRFIPAGPRAGGRQAVRLRTEIRVAASRSGGTGGGRQRAALRAPSSAGNDESAVRSWRASQQPCGSRSSC